MQLSTLQKQKIDKDVAEFAQAIRAGIVELDVRITQVGAYAEPEDQGNVFLSLFHPGRPAGGVGYGPDWSMLSEQIRPDGSIVGYDEPDADGDWSQD